MRVSVIIPTYNRRELVARAVLSVLEQTRQPDELLVVDDGSSDGTAESLRRQFGSGVRVIETPQRGVAAARNTGVRASGGEWLAFLDSDDRWLPEKLAVQLAWLGSNPEAQICQTEEIWIRNGRRVNPRLRHRKPSGTIFLASLELCLVSPSAVLLRRSLFERVGGFDESFLACEDYDLWLRISRDTPIWLIDRPLVVKHGGHADQLSRQHWGMDRFRIAAIARVLDAGGLPGAWEQQARRVLAAKSEVLAKGAEVRGRLEEAERYRRLARHYLDDCG